MGLIYTYFGDGAPPAFPPFPAFEGGGVIENSRLEFPCNWFQTYENHADEAHISFVHSTGGSHKALGRDQIRIPELSAEETDYGMIRYSSVNNGKKRTTLYLFPNTMRISIPAFSGITVGGWRDSYVTLVPTDDENHLCFHTQYADLKAQDSDAYRAAQESDRERMAGARKLIDIARDVLDGKASLFDFHDHPRFPLIEDAVAQGGQGAMVDRSVERLGRTDVCIARMRRLFARELGAIADGRAIKDWRYSGQKPDSGF